MARFDNTHSRVVAWAKVTLPLLALAILSTLFIVAREIDPDASIPFAELDVEELAREQRVGEPRFTTVTGDGAALSFAAQTARPDANDPDILNGEMLDASIQTNDGLSYHMKATAGVIDGTAKMAELGGGVIFSSSNGYEVTTDRIAATLDIATVETIGTVLATGPLGQFEAGKMTLTQGDDGDYLLVFNEGVKLVYTPQN